MKKCPFCAEEIQDAALVCKHCGRDLKGGASQVQIVAAKKSTSPAAWGCLTLLLLLFVGWCATATNRPTAPTARPGATNAPATAPAPAVDRLALLSARGYESEGGGYWYVEGQIRNISDNAIKGVMAVSTWYGQDDTFIKSDSAMIDFDPIMPGQTSPFKTISRGNPAMSKFSVTFKQILGGQIATRDDRKKK
jgi:hypothetical protein